MNRFKQVAYVYVLFKDMNNKYCFLLRSDTGYQDGNYGLPSGHVEDDETMREAATRELLEETAVNVSEDELVFKHVMHRNDGDDMRIDFFYEHTGYLGHEPINEEPHKHSEMAWFKIDKIPDNTMDYVKVAIERIQKGEVYSEWGWTDEEREVIAQRAS